METTFTLVAWVMLGWRFEQIELHDLSLRQCGVYQAEMLRERSPVRADCVPSPYQRAIRPPFQERANDRCFICGPPPDQPPPGHKRI
jgi:hypothetical protein